MNPPSRPLLVATRAFARLALSASALLVLLEASARLIVFGPLGLDPRRVGVFRDLDPADLVTYETDRAVLYEYKQEDGAGVDPGAPMSATGAIPTTPGAPPTAISSISVTVTAYRCWTTPASARAS